MAQPNRAERYAAELSDLPASTRELLEKYSHIPPDEVLSHVHTVRDRAWAVHPYPCIGQWRFLDLYIGNHPLYPEILSRLKADGGGGGGGGEGEGEVYLDLGCAFAQDVRRLVFDGVDGTRCYGSDLRPDFYELGYELFRDRATLGSTFIAADVLNPPAGAGGPLDRLDGRVDIIGASSFFHLFNLDEQRTAARRVLALMRPRPGSLVVGRQRGAQNPQELPRRDGAAGSRFRHNGETWRKLWTEVAEEVGVKLDVQSTTIPVSRPSTASVPQGEVGATMLEYSVRRL